MAFARSTCTGDYISLLPTEILPHIFFHLQTKDVLKCRLLSSHFKDLLSSNSFWFYQISLSGHFIGKDFKKLWENVKDLEWNNVATLSNGFYQKINKNLIINGSADLDKEHPDKPHGPGLRSRKTAVAKQWDVRRNYGDGWEVERPPYGADTLPEDPDIINGGCFVTSYGDCEMRQIVELFKTVHEEAFHLAQPAIYVSCWTAGRFDAPCVSTLSVTVLNKEKESLDSFSVTENLGSETTGTSWIQLRHTFPYNKDACFISVTISGSDSCTWSGWYGSKFTGVTVRPLPHFVPELPDS